MFNHDPHYVESHLDELTRLSKRTQLLQQALQTKPNWWDRLMVRLGSVLIALGSRMQEGRVYIGLSNHPS
jgi:hypothetical protein